MTHPLHVRPLMFPASTDLPSTVSIYQGQEHSALSFQARHRLLSVCLSMTFDHVDVVAAVSRIYIFRRLAEKNIPCIKIPSIPKGANCAKHSELTYGILPIPTFLPLHPFNPCLASILSIPSIISILSTTSITPIPYSHSFHGFLSHHSSYSYTYTLQIVKTKVNVNLEMKANKLMIGGLRG